MDEQRPVTLDPDAVERPPLPLGLWVVAVLLGIGGVVLLLAVLDLRLTELSGGLLGLDRSTPGRAVMSIFGVALLGAGVGMLMRFRSAWGLAMFLVTIGLAVNLFSYFRGDPNLLRLALFVATAFYLNQRAVREVFAERRPTEAA